MKRKLIAFTMSILLAAAPVTVFASEDDGMPVLETEYGIYELLGCDFYTYNDENNIIIFSRYENTTDENADPGMQYTIKAFQDGINLDSSYSTSVYDFSNSQWSDAKSSMTELQPGGSIVYYSAFQLESNSDISIEVSALWDWESTYDTVSYTFEYGVSEASDSGDSAEESVDYEAMYNELLAEYEQLKADYDALTNE